MDIIIISIACMFTFLVIFIVQKVMYKKNPSKEEIIVYQKALDKVEQEYLDKHNFLWKRDSLTEIRRNRGEKKCIVLMAFALIMLVVYYYLSTFADLHSVSIGSFVIGPIILIACGIMNFMGWLK